MAEDTPTQDSLPKRRGRKPGSKNKPRTKSASDVPATPKRRGRPPKQAPAPVVRPLWNPTPPTALPPTAVLASAETDPIGPVAVRERRISRILGRYVFGTIPLRGERWKRSRA
jgi:hypothetical protein